MEHPVHFIMLSLPIRNSLINVLHLFISGVYPYPKGINWMKIPKIPQILEKTTATLTTYPLQASSIISSEKIIWKMVDHMIMYLKNKISILSVHLCSYEKTIYKERSCPIFFHGLEAQSKQIKRVSRHSVRLFHNF